MQAHLFRVGKAQRAGYFVERQEQIVHVFSPLPARRAVPAAAPEAPAKPVPMMMISYFRLLAGLANLLLKRQLSHFAERDVRIEVHGGCYKQLNQRLGLNMTEPAVRCRSIGVACQTAHYRLLPILR